MPRLSSTNCLIYNTAVTGQYHWQALKLMRWLIAGYPNPIQSDGPPLGAVFPSHLSKEKLTRWRCTANAFPFVDLQRFHLILFPIYTFSGQSVSEPVEKLHVRIPKVDWKAAKGSQRPRTNKFFRGLRAHSQLRKKKYTNIKQNQQQKLSPEIERMALLL